MRRDYTLYLFAALGSFLIAYIAVPIAVVFIKQASDVGMLVKTLHDPYVVEAVRNSLLTATATALIALLFGVPPSDTFWLGGISLERAWFRLWWTSR